MIYFITGGSRGIGADLVARVLEAGHDVAFTYVSQAEAAEKERILRVLRDCRWNRSRAAARLGMHRTTLWRKMREWGLREERIP